MINSAEAGERQHRNAGNEIEASRHVSGAKRNLDQVFGGRLDVHAGIGEKEYFSFTGDDAVAAGDAMQALTHANNLQRGPDRIGKMLGHAGDERVGIAHAHHHGAKNVAVIDQRFGFLERDAAALA